jgi:hypothetical protein
VRRAIRAAGARLFYLPKFSLDLNPIEQFFAQFNWLRKAAQRTMEAVYDAIAPTLDTVSQVECRDMIKPKPKVKVHSTDRQPPNSRPPAAPQSGCS